MSPVQLHFVPSLATCLLTSLNILASTHRPFTRSIRSSTPRSFVRLFFEAWLLLRGGLPGSTFIPHPPTHSCISLGCIARLALFYVAACQFPPFPLRCAHPSSFSSTFETLWVCRQRRQTRRWYRAQQCTAGLGGNPVHSIRFSGHLSLEALRVRLFVRATCFGFAIFTRMLAGCSRVGRKVSKVCKQPCPILMVPKHLWRMLPSAIATSFIV